MLEWIFKEDQTTHQLTVFPGRIQRRGYQERNKECASVRDSILGKELSGSFLHSPGLIVGDAAVELGSLGPMEMTGFQNSRCKVVPCNHQRHGGFMIIMDSNAGIPTRRPQTAGFCGRE